MHSSDLKWEVALVVLASGVLLSMAAPAETVVSTNSPPATNDLDIPKELLEIPELSLSMWDRSLTLRSAVGYKDNVLLSSFHPQTSPYFEDGLDATLFHLTASGSIFSVFVTGSDTRYLNPPHGTDAVTGNSITVNNEDLAALAVQYKTGLAESWSATLPMHYTYLNQVFDLTTDPGVVTNGAGEASILAQGQTVDFRPSIRRQFGSNYWADLEWNATRQYFSAPLFTYWMTGPRLTLDGKVTPQTELTLSYSVYRILYDSEERAFLTGNIVTNSLLRFWRQQAEIKAVHFFDAARHWSSTTDLGFEYDADNGSGYYDYFAYRASQELAYQDGLWWFKARADASLLDFPWQTLPRTTAAKVYRATIYSTLRAERKLGRHFNFFTEFEHNWSLSNDPTDRYQVNNVYAGIELEF